MNKPRLFLAEIFCLLFLAAVCLVPEGRLLPLETAAAAWLRWALGGVPVVAVRAVTRLCDPAGVAALCLVLLALPATRRTVALPAAVSAVASALPGQLLKWLIARPRPQLPHLIAESGYSFPSGHSLTSAALCLTLILLLPVYVKPGRPRTALTALLAALPVLIGCSRVLLNVHYPGDVLAGWALGCAVGLLVSELWRNYIAR